MKNHTHDHHEKMQALQWEGKPFAVSLKTLPIPKIIKPEDAIIRCTTSGICGSEVHIFHGRFPVKPPLTLGHEIIGIVDSIGDGVRDLKVGDRVMVSGLITDEGLEGEAELVGDLGFGSFPGLEQFNGGQAAFVRVPFASDNCMLLPKGEKHELDYVALSDIFPTANWALDCSGFQLGDVVVVFGAGPVGLMTVYSAYLRGASKVYSVDCIPQRLLKAKELGAIPIDFTDGDPITQILKHEPEGVDRSCDCVGFECINAEGVNIGNLVLTQAITVTRTGGGIGVPGIYLPIDAGAATANEKKGIFEIPYGLAWFKSQSIKGGVVPLRQYQTALKKLIDNGRAKPGFIFDKKVKIDGAAKALEDFSNRKFIKAYITHARERGLSEVGDDVGDEKELGKKRKRT